MKKSSLLSAFCATAVMAIAAIPAQAAYIVTATETGGDVVFEGSGSLDLTAWRFSSTDNLFGSGLIGLIGLARRKKSV